MGAVVVKSLESVILQLKREVAVGRELWMRGGLAAAIFLLKRSSMIVTMELGAVVETSLRGFVEVHLALMMVADAGSLPSGQEHLVQQLEEGRRVHTLRARRRAPTGRRGRDLLTGSTCPTWGGGADKPSARNVALRETSDAGACATVKILGEATAPIVQTPWSRRRTCTRWTPDMLDSPLMASELKGGATRLGWAKLLCSARMRGAVASLEFVGASRRLGGGEEGRIGLPAQRAVGVTGGKVMKASCVRLCEVEGLVGTAVQCSAISTASRRLSIGSEACMAQKEDLRRRTEWRPFAAALPAAHARRGQARGQIARLPSSLAMMDRTRGHPCARMAEEVRRVMDGSLQ